MRLNYRNFLGRRRLIIILGILLVASVLRFYKLPETMAFISDFGWYYLSARDFLQTGNLPLVGIPSSVPILRQGAIFTWILAGVLKVFNYNPVSGAYLTSILGVLAVFLVYKVFSQWYGERIGFIASLFAAVSPFIVIQDRRPFVVGPMFILSLLVAWFFTKLQKGRPGNYALLGFLLGVLYQFELASFILFPILFLTFIWAKVKLKWKSIFIFAIGLIVGLLPFIIWDLQQGVYLQTIGFLAWVVTKAVEGLLGIFSGDRNALLFVPAIDFLQKFISPKSVSYAVFLFMVSIFSFLKKLMKESKELKVHDKLIANWSLVAVGGFFVRGIFSEAYMPLLYIPLLAILSFFFDNLILKWNRVGWLILFMTVFLNTAFLFKTEFTSSRDNFITFTQRLEAVDFILSQVGEREYSLIYRGPSYQFALGDNHWRYLLWWKGNEPKRDREITYGIFEYPYDAIDAYNVIGEFGYVKIGVKDD